VKRGVLQAGGLPLEFPTISLGEIYLSPTSMLFRNLMAMDTEEMILGQPMDGVVLLGGCDKTLPAQLMGAASADRPAIVVTGRPDAHGPLRGHASRCVYRLPSRLERAPGGRARRRPPRGRPGRALPVHRHLHGDGNASTMAAIAEALGMTLPGMAAVPAPLAGRLRLAEAAGRRIVEMVQDDLRPSKILTRAAFENAVRVLMAVGGSTNAVVHLPAIAGRAGSRSTSTTSTARPGRRRSWPTCGPPARTTWRTSPRRAASPPSCGCSVRC